MKIGMSDEELAKYFSIKVEGNEDLLKVVRNRLEYDLAEAASDLWKYFIKGKHK